MGIVVTICGLVILLGFEMRHRLIAEQLKQFDSEINRLDQELMRLREEVKKKQNIYEEYKPPAL